MDSSRASLTCAYDFELPAELIAQRPAEQRDASRLMVLSRDRIEHKIFSDLPSLLHPNDVLVLNRTRVIAARLWGRRAGSGGTVEVLLLHPAESMRYDPRATRWLALVRPARRLRLESAILFDARTRARVVAAHDEGLRELEFELDEPFEQFLSRAGRLPLPPYIHNDTDEAQERYQTVFAREPGSVAAPTASLHFTPELLQRIERGGVSIAELTLDVGLGTFRPLKSARLDEHTMHAERYTIPPLALETIERARSRGGRVIAAGTTVVRALEGSAAVHGGLVAEEASTALFIRPGFDFRVVDAIITNFHLPRSTLLVLVSAFAGRERVLEAYREAIEQRYRFFSFGDAMFIEGPPLRG
ncbi:MAG TPA: tRNA preQ1(34) S-adenosylmethionine ribosyltransferase-isomerase QueA [Candidatus Baltobacteraceae bacterium]|nr:tRNA preQ1(34) S-adenosylmethionine ribosyltransferase-isomerase QueA [Candidatus Baltobacteraceae bacterium]